PSTSTRPITSRSTATARASRSVSRARSCRGRTTGGRRGVSSSSSGRVERSLVAAAGRGPNLRGGDQVIEVAGAAEHPGAYVVVEVARQRADLEAGRADRALHLVLHPRPPGAEREKDARPFAAQRVHRAREEEPGSLGRVWRIGDDGVETPGQRRWERLAQVPPQTTRRKRRFDKAVLDECEHALVD